MISKQVQTRAKAIGALFSENPREGVLAFMLAGLLVAFVVVVLQEVWATLSGSNGYLSDELQVFAVSLTGLVGAVFAVYVSRDQKRASADALSEDARVRKTMGTAFAVAYIVAGVVALAVCFVKWDDSTSLLRSLAGTFFGTAVAAATALFGLQAPQRDR